MIAIYACKLYKASTRKSKIVAAIQNPINAPLVKQLNEYLDEEYRRLKDTPAVDSNVSENVNDKSASGDLTKGSTPSGGRGGSHPSAPAGPSLSEKYGDKLDAEGNASFEATQVSTDVDSEDDSETDDTTVSNANSSTAPKGVKIVADTVVTKPFVEHVVSLSGLAGELKGTLNGRSDTSGVIRVAVKNNEVWVHYNDNTNLNNVMPTVIDVLNAANYQYLIFNRLARSDNAIVFTVNNNDTENAMGAVTNE